MQATQYVTPVEWHVAHLCIPSHTVIKTVAPPTIDIQRVAKTGNFQSSIKKFTDFRPIMKNIYKQIVKLREVIHLFSTPYMIATNGSNPI
ncbi:hypothetical protein [Leisingera sp. F5]|uniref:hypothetical protein n=1 Tax=Leisingera sp. F5 TaxID=1813816 RepID=UPI0025C39495|nr:hypothetical protein [Leisingera sp. F5]